MPGRICYNRVMLCPSCGTANEESGHFCSSCRSPLPISLPMPSFTEPIINGRFQVIKLLGRGGTGDVLLAHEIKRNRKVAIKNISIESLHDRDSKVRFLHEARAAARLEHPNIRAIYEIAEEKGREYIVMQYVEGVTLRQLLKMKPLSRERVIDIASQIADGMDAAHGRNNVHRDIKPGNIMIDGSGRVKILDFGLAKVPVEPGHCEAEVERLDRALAAAGMVLGTASYMSPEQARGRRLDCRTDIFSYGVVLYEMIEGRNPFSGEDDIVTLYNILHRKVRFSGRVTGDLRSILRRALQKDRRRRYGSFNEVRRDLAKLKDDQDKPENNRRRPDQSSGGMAKRPDK